MIHVEMKNILKEITVTVTNSDRDVFTTRTCESHYTELQRIGPFRHSDISVNAVNQHGGRVLIYTV